MVGLLPLRGRVRRALTSLQSDSLFEFKAIERPSCRRRARRWRSCGSGLRGEVPSRDEPIHLIGVEYSRTARNVTALEVADGADRGQRAAP